MLRVIQYVLFFAVAIGFPALGQQTANPIAEHYRAYRAALERGDLSVADTEGAAALAQSQARDGNGGNTAALALNLALVRLSEGNRAQALAPAQLAAMLANNSQTHVNPMIADIALKRSLLAPGDTSAQDLSAVLTAAQAHGGLDEYVYDGAADLGGWALDQNQLQTALAAWRVAIRASPGNGDGAVLSRARAFVGVGSTLFQMDVATGPASTQRLQALPLHPSHDEATYRPNLDALAALANAANLLLPLALRPAPDGSLTRAQLEYSRAIVFMLADEARLASFNVDTSRVAIPNHQLELPTHVGETPCLLRIVAQPLPSFPPTEEGQGNLGAAMVRFVIDDSGRVRDGRVVATVGGPAFAQSINNVISRWRVERSPNSVRGCTTAATLFNTVRFVLAPSGAP